MERIVLLINCILFSLFLHSAPHFSVYEPLCNHEENPLNVSDTPCFSWKINSDTRGFKQGAYQILVADSQINLDQDKGNIWDSKKVHSSQSIMVMYLGKKPESGKTYYWKVRIEDSKGIRSEWSESASFTIALLNNSDWGKARWIALQEDNPENYLVPGIHEPLIQKELGNKEIGKYKLPQFRKSFSINKSVKKALVNISGLGHFELFLNGNKTGNDFLNPGWTKYDKNALYVTYDITNKLIKGANSIGVMLGNGFYNIPRERYFKLITSFGAPKMILKLNIEYSDGSKEEIVSDNSWRCSESAITFSSIYGGEDYDASKEQLGWKLADFNDSEWKNALITDYRGKLLPQRSRPLTIRQELPAVKVYKNAKGSWTYDLGQNFSGILRVKVNSNTKQSFILRPGELLNSDSTVNQKATGDPFYFKYTTSGKNHHEVWQAQFTYYGFRYVQLEGAVPKGQDNPNNLPEVEECTGLHTTLAADDVGNFSCSNPMFNKIYELIDWSIRSNMASVLTDCPHREKLGWLEVAHLMQYSIQYRYAVPLLYEKIMNDMRSSQNEKGTIATIAPEYVHFAGGFEDTPEWGSAFIISPWYVYLWYNDKHLLQEYYPSMQKYLEYLGTRADKHIVAYGLGDWFDIGPKLPGVSQLTSNGVTATALYYYNTCIMQKIAELLNKPDDAKKYQILANEIKIAFNDKFYNKETKMYDRNSQAANAIALYTGLASEYHDQIFKNLIEDIRTRNYALTAGDIGYRYVLRALEQNGASNIIYNMNSKYDVPGYGWQLAYGATSLTESWQAYGFVSNNHCMLGHLMEWLFSGLGGISQADDSRGFETIIINPQIVGDITSAKTRYKSPYGIIRCEWEKQDEKFKLSVEVPENSKALIHLPCSDPSKIKEYGQSILSRRDLEITDKENSRLTITVGSGKYLFTMPI